MIHLIGPGGAGKSTVAPYVADLLGYPSLDLDRAFEAAYGDIDHFISAHGYGAYAGANVATYLAHRSSAPVVVVLSSGFMVYPENVYPGIRELQQAIAAAPTTILLLPSLDVETCVAETVRRQATRDLPIHRSAVREEAVIRERFAQYRSLTDRLVTTMQPLEIVARNIVDRVGGARDVVGSACVLSNDSCS
jgi:shikimate kinase